MSSVIINPSALEPLFAPWEFPNRHRVRAKKDGDPARIVKGRRPTSIVIAQNLRQEVGEWRENGYPGASDTTRELLVHWFERSHLGRNREGSQVPFRYYFCQREAIETFIYLMEVRALRSVSEITAEFGGPDRETAALGINPEEDLWPRYAFKVATGAGKTKIMSLAVVWSYFHALRESDSPMTRHFVMVAPGLTVFERLREDFGDGRIFDNDPLIPTAWRGDWNLSVVLQDEASGAATGGTLYLTNIHRLYDVSRRRKKKEAETYPWAGPPVRRAKVFDTGEALRERITGHQRVLVFNDEAHHLWDPESAWNEALGYLHETIRSRTRGGLVAQLDFSATPKDNHGRPFGHIVCDAPLGEAVDAGIVKTPIIGEGKLTKRAHKNAAYKYEMHLRLGYERWLRSHEEWKRSGKKALLFVMTEDTPAADQIAKRLNTDPIFKELNGKTVNLHTNLKGKVRKRGRGKDAQLEFVESEKEISDEDLKALRELSRQLDQDPHYRCIVSVLMLREGWDVRNVTTIVPLRPYTSKANILPEQTLGRGLRRMMRSGGEGTVAEVVTVVQHEAFTSFYKRELAQEGVLIEVVDADKVPSTTVTIYPDAEHKDLAKLDLLIPRLSPGYRIVPRLEDLTFEEVKKAFARLTPLPLGEARPTEVDYEGRHLITNEIVERMKVKLDLLQDGIGAISFFREELEHATNIRGIHAQLAPLIQRFLEEVLFEEKVEISDPRLVARLADSDVREHIRATFVPLIRSKTTHVQERTQQAKPASIAAWKPFQATHSERRRAIPATKTVFNLVPCDRGLEVTLAEFADQAPDVAAFAKNAGPQSLRIDYLAAGRRLAFYTPDFLVRLVDGNCLLVETKGRQDRDVPAKARAAVAWCKAASGRKDKWKYLYVPEDVFARFAGNQMKGLARACAPALSALLEEAEGPGQGLLPFEQIEAARREEAVYEYVQATEFDKLPSRHQKAIRDAVALYDFWKEKENPPFGSVFQPLLGVMDGAAFAVVLERLQPMVPVSPQDQRVFFNPHLGRISEREQRYYRDHAQRLMRALVHHKRLMPLGLLAFCLDYASKPRAALSGVFKAVSQAFSPLVRSGLYNTVTRIKDFRNEYVAHAERRLADAVQVEEALRLWIRGLLVISRVRHG